MRSRYGAHGVGDRIIVQEDTAATIHLEVDKARCQERTLRARRRCDHPAGTSARRSRNPRERGHP